MVTNCIDPLPDDDVTNSDPYLDVEALPARDDACDVLEREDADRQISVVLHAVANLAPAQRQIIDALYLNPKPLGRKALAESLSISLSVLVDQEQAVLKELRQSFNEARLPDRDPPTPCTRAYIAKNQRPAPGLNPIPKKAI